VPNVQPSAGYSRSATARAASKVNSRVAIGPQPLVEKALSQRVDGFAELARSLIEAG